MPTAWKRRSGRFGRRLRRFTRAKLWQGCLCCVGLLGLSVFLKEMIEMNTLESIKEWFKAAKPNPTEKDKATQIGAYFEEVSEMMWALHCNNIANKTHELSEEFYISGTIDEDILGNFIILPEEWEIDLLDSLCDQIVTAIGVGYMMGFDMVGALQEVNLSNWSKFDENGNPIFNENGKIVKGENYFKPDLAKFVRSNNAPAAE